MIGHSIPEYVFIRVSITILRLIAPLSIIYLAGCYYTQQWILSPWLSAYAAVEATFYLLIYLPRSMFMQKVRQHHMSWSYQLRDAYGEIDIH